jgi:hypothetical protein
MIVFVDTGAWIALLNRNDRHHEQALRYYDEAAKTAVRLLTSSDVVDETVTRLRYDVGLPAALAFRTMLDDVVASRRARIAWVDEGVSREAWALLERFADVELSLTDATSAVVARRSNVSTVFGFDRDFRALGFDLKPI